MRRRSEIAALVIAFGVVGSAQQPPAPAARPTFEAVSIKEHTSGTGAVSASNRPNGSMTATNVTLTPFIAQAYGVRTTDIVGLPAWVNTARFDINAVVAVGAPQASAEQRRAMMRAMFQDRLQLETHIEMREVPAFNLVLAREDGRLGPGLVPSSVDCNKYFAEMRAAADAARAAGQPMPPPGMPGPNDVLPPCSSRSNGRLYEGTVPIAVLAVSLRSMVGRPVIDATGLKGYFDVRLEQSDMAGAPPAAAGGDAAGEPLSIFTAVREQLGLRFEPSKTTIEVLVVDRIERPSAN